MILPKPRQRQFDGLTQAVFIAVMSLFVGAVLWFGPSAAMARIVGGL